MTTTGLRPGLVTSIGSLPHRDADNAAEFILRHHPQLPAAPQLPRRSPLEGMIAQAARGIPGVAVAADGSLSVDSAVLDPDAPVTVNLDGAGHAGLLAFLSCAAGRTAPVKVQLTGPITLGLALVEAGVEPDVAFATAAAAVRANGRALVELCRRRLPEAPIIAFLDEPGLVTLSNGELPLEPDRTIDILSSALAALEGEAVTGVHCCGPTDWRLVSSAGPVILSLPADTDAVDAAMALTTHIERGGWIAWGVVPTARPIGTDVEPLWRRLSNLWCELVSGGADPVQVRTQSLLTPACGLAGHGVTQAVRCLQLATQLSRRVSDQTVAARLAAGA